MKDDDTFSKLSERYLSDKVSKNGLLLKSSSSDLIITSDTINVIEKENYKSYTIRIKRTDESSFHTENLIIEEKEGIQSAYILSYKFQYDWLIDFNDGKRSRPKADVFYSGYDVANLKSNSELKSSNCRYVDVIIAIPCSCGHTSIPLVKDVLSEINGHIIIWVETGCVVVVVVIQRLVHHILLPI